MSDVSSMTGFANAHGHCALGNFIVEIRCVNSRYLDISTKIADEFRASEALIHQAARARVNRGKFECRVELKSGGEGEKGGINAQALKNLLTRQKEVLAACPGAREMSVAEILTFPGISEAPVSSEEELTAAVLSTFNEALSAFTASRIREGNALSKVLCKYCDEIDGIVHDLSAFLPKIHENLNQKLNERLNDALRDSLSENSGLTAQEVSDRIRQEVTLYAIKMDVEEEMKRLTTHTAEVRRVLATGGSVGRRLDFLTQELNREANTLGSKAAAVEMTNASLALKVRIDQMREQVQNLE